MKASTMACQPGYRSSGVGGRCGPGSKQAVLYRNGCRIRRDRTRERVSEMRCRYALMPRGVQPGVVGHR
jgi:hypothetical protein